MARPPTKAEKTAARLKAADRTAVPFRIGALFCSFTAISLNAGGAVGVVIAIVFSVLLLALLAGIVRWSSRRYQKSVPEGFAAQAGALALKESLATFDPSIATWRRAKLVGTVCAGPNGLLWRPARRFRRKGASDVDLAWAEVADISSARRSANWIRWLATVDVFCIDALDGRSLTLIVTNPSPIHAALRDLRVPVADPVS